MLFYNSYSLLIQVKQLISSGHTSEEIQNSICKYNFILLAYNNQVLLDISLCIGYKNPKKFNF